MNDVTTNVLFEDLGPNTACFDHSELTKQNETSIHTISKSSSCHKFECSTWKGLQIIVIEQRFPCSTGSNTANATFTIQSVTYSMTIFCPTCRSLCKYHFKITMKVCQKVNSVEQNIQSLQIEDYFVHSY
ncbi:Leishmanolysin-like peptidase [Schistosoma japonicum]|nr:Leishmanolysin-like peptidase [Schistosoma japonicum]